jgi:hypothetical protein
VADIDGKHRAISLRLTVQICHRFLILPVFTMLSCLFCFYLEMVEAVGVEPTSEIASNREHSCFFRFIFVSSSTLRTDEDAPTTSLINLVRPAQTEQGRPAYCATIGTSP